MLEICVDTISSAILAEKGGAGRVELCTALCEGGLTPSIGTVQTACKALSIPVIVMIRPRGGDFVYSEDEILVMLDDIAAVKKAGAAGIAIGCLATNGTVDVNITQQLVNAARPMIVTFHRAIDMARDLREAFGTLTHIGVDCVLTSGGRAKAMDSLPLLKDLAIMANETQGRTRLMVGGSVRPDNIGAIVEAVCGDDKETPISIFLHSSGGRKSLDSTMLWRNEHVALCCPALVSGDYSAAAIDTTCVAEMAAMLHSWSHR